MDIKPRRVVVTGVSAIAADSKNVMELWTNLNKAHHFVVPINEKFEKNYKYKTRFYVPFPEFKLDDYGIPSKAGVFMEENSKIAVSCAKQALEDAGFNMQPTSKNTFDVPGINDAGVIIGMSLGALRTAFNSVTSHISSHLNLDEFKAFRFNRMVIPITMDSCVAAWISILFGINGPAFSLNTSCASGNYAIGEAYKKIYYGERKVMITGGVECFKDDNGSIMRGFDTLGALTHSSDGKPQSFSNDRSGFLFSEGGCGMLILEEYEHALQRGAKIYAEIEDCSFTSDSNNIVQMDDAGTQIMQVVKNVSSNRKIDYFNAHGTATHLNDMVESNMIKELFGNKEAQPYINSTKSILGHNIGASSAIEAIVTAMSIKEQRVHPNLSNNNIDNLNVVTESMPASLQYAISASYGFGGHNSAILFKKV